MFGSVDFPVLSASPILERHGSPPPAEEQRVTKKVKNRLDGIDGMQLSEVHEAGSDVGSDELMRDGEGDEDQPVPVNSVEAVSAASLGAARSYVAAVSGSKADKETVKSVLNSDDIVVLDEDVVVDESGPYTIIKFSERVHDAVDRSLGQTVIVRLLGRQIGYRMLWNRIKAMWVPQGQFQLVDLENDYFLVKFELKSDYDRVLADGPWTIFGSYLTVQPWTREFSTDQVFPSHVLVWIRLPGLPYRYYTKALFRRIAAVLGRIVKVDYNTVAGDRGKFARIAVLIDLTKPLRSCLGIDDFMQHLEYEGLHNICFQCGLYGHSKEMCGVSSGEQGSLVTRGGHSFPFSGDKRHAVTTEELYGPWMVAGDRKRLPRKQIASDKGMNLTTGKSRFDVLATEAAAADVPEVGDLISSVAHVSTKAGTSVNNDKRANVQDDQSSTHVAIDTELRDVVVESMVPGRTPLVIGSNPGLKSRHKAVTIVDDGFDLEGGKRGGFKKGSSSMGKLRLQVRKQSVFKAPNLSRLSEWIDTLPNREGADKQSHIVDTSASAQADPPDPIAPFQNIHGNGPGGSHDNSEMVQVGEVNRPGQTLEC
ncbi:hypothetical protein GQ457_06G023040 [Hibiscus cannabinus]